MQIKELHDTNTRSTTRWEHRLHSTLTNRRIFTSTNLAALIVVISLSAIVPCAHGEVRASSFGPTTAIASARQAATERPSQYLGQLQLVERRRVSLEVNLAGSSIADYGVRASMVESLWREGRHEDALVLLRTLEDQKLVAGVGFDWKTPWPTQQPQDVKSSIDGTGGAGQVVLEHDPSSGNLFAVIQWGASWGLFISHDQGASWSESYHYSGVFPVSMKVDLEVHNHTVQGDFAYVAYSYNGNLAGTTAVAKIRRFATANGAYDESWGANTPITDETRNFKEIALSVGVGIDYVILRDDMAERSRPGQPVAGRCRALLVITYTQYVAVDPNRITLRSTAEVVAVRGGSRRSLRRPGHAAVGTEVQVRKMEAPKLGWDLAERHRYYSRGERQLFVAHTTL